MTQRTRTTIFDDLSGGSYDFMAMTDTVVPEFHKLLKSGVLINNPMSLHKAYGSASAGRKCSVTGIARQISGSGSFVWTKDFYVPWAMSKLTSSNVLASIQWGLGMAGVSAPSAYNASVLQTEVSAEIATQATQSLVSLVEGPKTLSMLAKAYKFLRRPLGDAMRELRVTRSMLRDRATRAQVLDKASNAWLEGRYGWRPFIYDVMGHVDAMLSQTTIRKTERVKSAPIEGTWSTTNDAVTSVAGNRVWWTYKVTARSYVRCGQTVDFPVSLASSRAFHYGLYDVTGTAWELIPLSFVYDWFLNVGDMLKALQVYAYADERIGWNTFVSEVVVEKKDFQVYQPCEGLSKWGYRYYTTSVVPPEGWSEVWVQKNRVPVDSFLPMMGFRCRLNTAKIVDLAAILRQMLRPRVSS